MTFNLPKGVKSLSQSLLRLHLTCAVMPIIMMTVSVMDLMSARIRQFFV